MSDPIPEDWYIRVGHARRRITPPVGVSLAGYFHDRKSASIRDDLYARALVIESGDSRLALVSCDLICMTAEVSGTARKIIENECGIPPANILIAATHTHTGPEIRPGSSVPRDDEYADNLPRLIADAVREAAELLFPATLHPGRTHLEGYSFNRLFRLKDGTELFGKHDRDAEIIGPAGPVDTELQTLTIIDEETRPRAMIVNFALHPDVIGGGNADFISADWPGIVAETLSATYGEKFDAIFLQGAAGDINHWPHDPTYLPDG
ncbi:neutral/alkaline non-lysosomal ceramidase N-terminal domain-containing protein, partial [bacterium]|nr:neutral/alkaline non-lysosomal ceramidase N-terminal domain-containing protein [bacterium]